MSKIRKYISIQNGKVDKTMYQRFLHQYKGILLGIFTATFAMVYLIGSTFIRRTDFIPIGAEFMPKIYGFVLLLLGALQIYQGFKETKHLMAARETNGKEPKDSKNVVLTFILIIAYVASMQILGFIISSTLFMFLMSMLLAPPNTKRNNIIAIALYAALSGSTFYLFNNVLHLFLPIGIIFGS
jgi:putative tricarboxylic transport membrane protein